MKIIEPSKSMEEERLGQYFPVTYEDGRVTCSCGNQLIKMDEHTYRCAAGWPTYRFDEGDIIKDKFGNLLMKAKEH